MFSVHGDWRILVIDNYVLQWFSGTWNEEAAIQYSQEFKEKTAQLNGNQWAIFSLFDDWELGVPEIESHLIAHCQAFKDNGCVKDCHVYAPSVWKNMLLENIVPQSAGHYERQVFSSAEDAIQWMKSCGFSIQLEYFLQSLPKGK